MSDRPPLPPFTAETAATKVQAAEDAWKRRDPHRVVVALTDDSERRNGDSLLHRRAQSAASRAAEGGGKRDYPLLQALWAFTDDRIAVRFQYEWHDPGGRWTRSYGNELWEFDAHGLMRRREASINDVPITAAERRITGPRPPEEHGREIPLR